MTSNFNEGSGLIGKWITTKNTLEYLSIWESINNITFNYPEFGVIEKEAGVNRFIMSAGQWIGRTGAKGIIVKAGRFGGTYAHKDIAFHFAMWLSPEFQIYLIKEFQRLKEIDNDRLKLDWNLQRTLAKVNYRIHTDDIKENNIEEILVFTEKLTQCSENFKPVEFSHFGKTKLTMADSPQLKVIYGKKQNNKCSRQGNLNYYPTA